jgi:hypothetical protein
MALGPLQLPSEREVEATIAHYARETRVLRSLLRALRRRNQYAEVARRLRETSQEANRGA